MRKNLRKSFLIFILLLLGGCAAVTANSIDRKVAAEKTGGEFYFVSDLPMEKLAPMRLEMPTLISSSKYVGGLFLSKDLKLDKVKVQQYRDEHCGEGTAINFEEDFCKELAAENCKNGCNLHIERLSCSGVRIGKYFVTARHCLPNDPKALKDALIKFSPDNTKLVNFEIDSTKYTYHKKPYDVAIFKIRGVSSKSLQVRKTPPAKNEVVFGIGFPYLAQRAAKIAAYKSQNSTMRVTVGSVTNPNAEKKSFCEYTNEDNVTNTEKWTLQKSCASVNYAKFAYKAREEKDPFLTNTDMTWGMSGSPLFDRVGKLLGIGSNVLSNDPRDYDPAKNAIYVKVKNVMALIEELDKKKR